MRVRIVSVLALVVVLLVVAPSAASANCVALCQPEDSTTAPPPEPTPAPEPQPAPAPEPAPAPQPGDTVSPAGAERLLELINQSRAEHGMPAMAARADVASIAVEHSKAMAAEGDIWHNDAYFTSATKQRLRAKTVGENVALNSSIDDAHRRLMNSPGHRANILNTVFTVVGIGVVQKATGSYYITQDFVQPLPEAAPAKPAGAAERPRSGAPAPSAPPSTASPAAAPTTTEALPSAATVAEDAAGSIGTTTSLPRQLQAGAVPSDAKSATTLVALLLLGATGAAAGRRLRRRRSLRAATAG